MQGLINRTTAAIAAAALLSAAAACDRPQDQVTEPAAASQGNLTPAASFSKVLPGEEAMADIARDVPSYGGHFVDRDGRLAMYVTDRSAFGAARTAMTQRIQSGRIRLSDRRATGRIGTGPIVMLDADFTYRQLSAWRDTVFASVLGKVAGVVTDDLDEASNRVTIGVAPGREREVEAAVRQRLASSGVPAKALKFIPQAPIVAATAKRASPSVRSATVAMLPPGNTLGDWADELSGGLRIEWTYENGNNAGGCTIGFTVQFANGGHGFITASHCSEHQFGADYHDLYYQPDHGYVQSVGYEGYDPNGGSCPALGWPCDTYRFSDANLNVATDGARGWRRGVIARPSTRNNNGAHDITINSAKPYLFVTGVSISPFQGELIDKIGASTGWSYGTITQTCVDFVQDRNFYQAMTRCAYHASAIVGPGDSGGPVFIWDGEDGAAAAGIIMAESDGGTAMWFSKWTNVMGDLNSSPLSSSLTVVSDITMSGTPDVTGSLSGGSPSLTWNAATVTNTNNPTTYKIIRATWDADRGSYIDNGELTSTTSTSWTDPSTYLPVDTYLGTSYPGTCDYSWVSYQIKAYNSGMSQMSAQTIYFRGAASQNGCNGG